MSRKAANAAKAPLHNVNKLSTLDGGHPDRHIERRNNTNDQDKPRIQKNVNNAGMKKALVGKGVDDTTTEIGDGDADDGDGNGADADGESSDSEDPDVSAPSGRSTDADEHQTGPATNIIDTSTSSGFECHLPDHSQKESSDDEFYAEVDLISDSEKDGSEMDHLEERAIVESESTGQSQQGVSAVGSEALPAAKSSLHDLPDDAWHGFEMDDTFFEEPSDFFHEQFSQLEQHNLLSEYDHGFSGFATEIDEDPFNLPTPAPQRRVRFADPPHLEIAGSNDHEDLGIATFRDDTPGPVFSSSGIDYTQSSDSDSSSGYESDYGETTDEDEVPPSATARPQALIRRPTTLSTKPTSPATPSPARKLSGQHGGPRMGSWCVDPTKPLAFVDSCGKRLLVCPARHPKKPDRVFEHMLDSGSTTANTSPHPTSSRLASAPNDSDFDPSDLSSQGMVSPMFGPPNPLDSILSDNNFLTTGTAYSDYSAAEMGVYGDLEYVDDDDDHEDGITMGDLINLSSEDDESDVELGDARPLSSDSSHNVLDHLDSGVISAFRQSQRQDEPERDILQPRSPLRKRKASPPLASAATRRRIMA